MRQQNRLGFTLIELLVVISTISILSGVIFSVVDPFRQLSNAHDAQRRQTARQLENAVYQELIDTNSMIDGLSEGQENAKAICRYGISSDACVSFDDLIPEYIAALSTDPSEIDPRFTGYVAYLESSRIQVRSNYLGEGATADNYAISYGDMIAHWNLESGQGTVALDASGNGYNGALNGNASWSTDIPNLLTENTHSVSFSGNNGWLGLDTLSFNDETGSVSFWVKTKSSPTGGTIVFRKDIFINRNNYNNKLLVSLGNNGQYHDTSYVFIDDEWTHLVLTWGSGIYTLYANGSVVETNTISGSIASEDSLTMGAWQNGINPFNGLIDDVRLYDKTLSAQEVLDIAAGL